MERLLSASPLFFYIIAGIGVFIGVYYVFRNLSLRAKMIFLYVGCAVCIVFFIINRTFLLRQGEHPLTLLPLHLCNISLLLTPVALKFKMKVFYDFIFYISSLTAVFAILSPAASQTGSVISLMTFTYFSYHYFVVCVPLWLFLWKIYSPKLSLKDLLRLYGVLILLAVLVHVLNIVLVNSGLENANYFWTMMENGSKNVSILALFASVLPMDLLYLVFCLPILGVYIGIWNFGIYFKQRTVNSEQRTVNREQ
jgi:uncharacterized membrane protein YwaF